MAHPTHESAHDSGSHDGGEKSYTPGMVRNAVIWVTGGLCAATGMVTAVAGGGFGMKGGGDTAVIFKTLGYDGLDNFAVGTPGLIAIGLLLTGVALLATASAGAWKETGGY